MIKAPLRILIVAGVCLAALVGLVVREGMAREAGTEVLLPMEAVDPRSLLGGHYVIVQLQETLPLGAPCPQGAETGGAPGWLALTPTDGDTHAVASVSATKEEAKRVAELVVAGEAYCNTPFVEEGQTATEPAVLRYNVGIDRFHIDQQGAMRIETILREQTPDENRVRAIVSIGADNRARLKGLLIDGERMELSWF